MKMKRREFVTSVIAGGLAVPAVASREQGHGHDRVDGPLSSANVSFGAWPAGGTTPLDRFATPNAPDAPNVHQIIPFVTTIKSGGTINFTIAGFHVLAIYGPGTKPDDIDATIVEPIPGAPPDFPPGDRRSERTSVSRNQSHHASAGSRRGGTIQPPRDVSRHLRFPAALRR